MNEPERLGWLEEEAQRLLRHCALLIVAALLIVCC